jgi:hypothetical protein
MRTCLTALIVLMAIVAVESAPEPVPQQFVLTNVNVVDTRSGNVDRHLTILVRNGRIASIGRLGLVGGGPNIRVVNGNGRYVIPGLWDMHVHSAGGPAGAWNEKVIYPLYVANGVTGVRDMGGDPDLLEGRRQRIREGDLIGPRLVMAGPFLDGGQGDVETIPVNGPGDAHAAVIALKKRGVDFIKILSNLSHDTYLAVAEECRRQHIQFAGHVPDSVSASEASSDNQRSIEHLTGILLACSSQEEELRQQRLDALARKDLAAYSAARKGILETYDPRKAYNLFVQLSDNNTYQVPTLIWTQSESKMDDATTASDPRLQYVPRSVRKQWERQKQEAQDSPQDLADAKKLLVRYLGLVGAMHKAGVRFMAGTDGPDPYVFPGFSLHDELELLVMSGFSPAQALQSATFYPALFMAKLDQYGVIDKGRQADMVVLDGNPVVDIRNTRKIDAVVLGGRYYSREELNAMLLQAQELASVQ